MNYFIPRPGVLRNGILSATILSGALCPQALAQEIEEIVVSAQKKDENLQDVPISISVVSAEEIDRANIRTMQDMQLKTPGLVFSTDTTWARPYIRGIGTQHSNAGLETSTATYVDDVYVQRQLGAIFEMLDTESIQVLKGPQGSLYGRNATGGAILITSANPVAQSEGFVKVDYGRFNRRQIEAMVNQPLSDAVIVRLAARWVEDDGYGTNTADGAELFSRRGPMARAKIDWTPSEDIHFLLSSEYMNTWSAPGFHQSVFKDALCVTCTIFDLPPAEGKYATRENTTPDIQIQYAFQVLRGNFRLDRHELTTITSYRQHKWDGVLDLDLSTEEFQNFSGKEFADTFSQEVRLASDLSGAFNYLVGVNYGRDNSRFYSDIFGSSFGAAGGIRNRGQVVAESISAYAEGYYSFADHWKLTLGGRYSHDDKELDSQNDQIAAVVFGIDRFGASANFSRFTPRAVLAYTNDLGNFYLTYNQGFKSGGISTPAFSPVAQIAPEVIDSVELGAKLAFLENRIRSNIAVFHYKHKDLQVTFTDVASGGSITENAASVKATGVEIETEMAVTDRLQAGVGAQFMDGKFEDFPASTSFEPTALGFALSNANLTNTRLSNAPRWSGFANMSYTFPLPGGWDANLAANARYTTDYDFVPGAGGSLRVDRQPAVMLANVTGYVEPAENLRVGFYVNNATDRYYFNTIETGQLGAFRVPAPPRTYGITLAYRF